MQERSRVKYRDNRLLQNKKYGEDCYNCPEIKERLEKEYDVKYFGGNRAQALIRDGFK